MLPSWQASPGKSLLRQRVDSQIRQRNVLHPSLPTGLRSAAVASLNYPPFNWDFLSAIHTEALEKCLETHRVILSRTNNLPDPTDPSELEEYESWVEWFRGFVPPEEDPGEPVNDIFYPILDSDLETVRIGDTVEDPNAPKMVGLLVRKRLHCD